MTDLESIPTDKLRDRLGDLRIIVESMTSMLAEFPDAYEALSTALHATETELARRPLRGASASPLGGTPSVVYVIASSAFLGVYSTAEKAGDAAALIGPIFMLDATFHVITLDAPVRLKSKGP